MALSAMLLLLATSSATLNKTTGGGGLHPIWVTLRRVPQAVWDASLADRGPLNRGQMGQDSPGPSMKTSAMKTTTMTTMKRTIRHPRTGGFQDQTRLGLFVLLLGSFGLLAPEVPVRGRWDSTGGRCIPMVFP
jgi:hypothetical protein